MITKHTPDKTAALIVAVFSSFLAPFMGSSVNVALPIIGKEFAMDAILLSWITTAYLLAASALLVPFGRLADIHGRKKIFTIGIWIFSIGAVLTAFADSSTQLILCRIFQGIGSAMIFSTGLAILTSVFPPHERGKVLGINIGSVYLGLLLGPFFGGLLTEHLGWRSLFVATLPLSIVVILLLLSKEMKGDWAEAKGERFDITGSVIYVTAIVALMSGFSELPETRGALLLLAGIIGIALFLILESRISSPVLSLTIFRNNRTFTFSNAAAFINYSATFASGFLLSLYLQYIKAMSPQQAGTVLMAAPAIMAFISPFAGRLSDRIEPRAVATAGMSLNVVGLMLYALLNESSSATFIIFSLLLNGLGFGLFSSPNTNAIMGSVDSAYLGVASGTNATMRATGMVFSMGIAMLIFALYIGRVEITPESYPEFLVSMRIIFVIFTILCAIGSVASFAGRRKH